MVKGPLRDKLPNLLSTSVATVSLIVWDAQIPEKDAKKATEGLQVNVDSVSHPPNKTDIHFEEDRISHKEIKQVATSLKADFDYDTAQATSVNKQYDSFQRALSDGSDTTYTTRLYPVIMKQNSGANRGSVLELFSDKTEVMSIAEVRDRVVFGTHVMFLYMADDVIERLGISSEDVIYTSKLLEVENELLSGT